MIRIVHAFFSFSNLRQFDAAYLFLLFVAVAVRWTATPPNPTKALIGSNVTFKWEFNLNNEILNQLMYNVSRRSGEKALARLTLNEGKFTKEIYTDFKGRVDLVGNSTLILYNVTLGDRASYLCTLTTKNGSSLNNSVMLEVQGK